MSDEINYMFISNNFKVPHNIIIGDFYLEVLSIKFADQDYEAVMSSKEKLRKVFAENDTWPKDNMSFEENEKDLFRHEKEFEERKAFAYSVLSIDKKEYIGCIYVDPPTSANYDSEIYLWVKNSKEKLDDVLFQEVKKWIKDYWPFSNPSFPGRETDWTKRNQLKNN